MSDDDPVLARAVITRATIYDMPRDATFEQVRTSIPDAGRRRLLSWGMDFDTRAMTLGMKIEEHWETQVKQGSQSGEHSQEPYRAVWRAGHRSED